MNEKIKVGKILIAEPFMLDPNFKRSIVLIVEHNENGTTGFVLNKPLDIKISEVIGDLPEKCNAAVHVGGPVSVDNLFYLHNVGDILDDSVEVSHGVYWGGDFEKLKFLMENGLIQDHNIKFFIGYSGWTPGQLEQELEESSWLVDDMDANYLFKIRSFVLWQTVMHNRGNTYTVIAQMPDGISLN